MSTRASSLTGNSSVAVNREIDSKYDDVKLVAEHIGEVEAVSEAITSGALEVANSIAGDLQAVGGAIVEVTTVGSNIGSVNTVAANVGTVGIVAGSITNINALGPIASGMAAIADELDSVVTVANADNLADIKRVADDLNAIDDNLRADITLVAGDLNLGANSNVVIVSDSIADISTVADGMADITAVGSNISSVVVSSDNIGDIVVVASDLTMAGWSSLLDAGSLIEDVESEPTGVSLIETVADNIGVVTSVGNNISSVVTAAASIASINTNAANIVDIQNAAENAAAAVAAASTATTKAGEASISAATAVTQAGIATTKASEATVSASSASGSATTATTQAGIATTKAAEASSSATSASASASTATTKASESSVSASNAAISEANALTYKNSASASANIATTKAAEALTSADNAAIALASTQALYDSFDDRYLGTKTSDPLVDNDGNALVVGTLYYNSSMNSLKVYNGSGWVAVSVVDVYTKAEIDGLLQGLKAKGSVVAATTTNITLSGLQTIDTVAVAANDRVLVKDQTTASQNGIYIASSGAWVRSADTDTSAEITSAYVFVEKGSANIDTAWVMVTDNVTLGSTALTWVKFAGSGAYAAASHTHSTADITSGTLSVIRGGTGVATSTGSGSVVLNTSPTLVTPVLGVATGTSFNSITGLSSTTPNMNGTASVGTSTTVARADHIHASDTTKANLSGATFTGAVTAPSFNSITALSSSNPLVAGTVAIGTSTTVARADHVHPAQTSVTGSAGSVVNSEIIKFDTGTTEGTDLYTFNGSTAKTIDIKAGTNVTLTKSAGSITINAASLGYTLPAATSTALGGVKVSATQQTVSANAVTSTAAKTYAVQLDASNNAVVNVPWVDTNTVYTHPTSGVGAGTYRSVTVDTNGHVTAGTNPTTIAGYSISDAYTKTEVQTVLPKVGFDTTNVTAPSVGQMAWNIDENTVDVGLNGATLQIGQEQVIRVRNNTGSTITNGTAVMATGTLGASGRITVAPANINGSNCKYVLGVVTESIAAGADGFCTVFGKVRNIQTNGANYGETWVDGDVIYVKDNNGGALTKVVPTGTQVKLPIAIVINSHATSGTLFIRVTPIDENASYTKVESNSMFVPLGADFILDLGGII